MVDEEWSFVYYKKMDILARLSDIHAIQESMLRELDSISCDTMPCKVRTEARLVELELQLATLVPTRSGVGVVPPVASLPTSLVAFPVATSLPAAIATSLPAAIATSLPAAAIAVATSLPAAAIAVATSLPAAAIAVATSLVALPVAVATSLVAVATALPAVATALPTGRPCDQSYRELSSVRDEVYHKLLLRTGCIPRILLPDSLRFANGEYRFLSQYLDLSSLTDKTVASILFQMLWTLLVIQYTWVGARLDGKYLTSVPIHIYDTPRAMQLTIGDEKTSFRIDSVVVPIFYNMWYFMTCKADGGTRVMIDARPFNDVSDCTSILEEFASHPEKPFDIARKLLKYRSNAYALVLSDEFRFLRAPPQPGDVLLRL